MYALNGSSLTSPKENDKEKESETGQAKPVYSA